MIGQTVMICLVTNSNSVVNVKVNVTAIKPSLIKKNNPPVENLSGGRRHGTSGRLLSVADDDVEGAVDLGRVVLAVAYVDGFGRGHHLAAAPRLITNVGRRV